MDILQTIQERLGKGVLTLGIDFKTEDIKVESTNDSSHGDYSSNVAMQLSGILGKSPREIAQVLVDAFEKGEEIEKVEIAGPGFINFYVSNQYLVNEANEILRLGEDYFRLDVKKGKKIVIEYTSTYSGCPTFSSSFSRTEIS